MRLRASRVIAGGHSYGGRQSSMAAAEDSRMVDALLLLSYPLHPPRKVEQMRTAHFGELRTPAFFVHGSRDPFGSVLEMTAALNMIPARTELMVVEGAPHGLAVSAVPQIVEGFCAFLDSRA
jgi:predicted alpha/beta-hydrolase family hydrolase